MKQSTKDEMLSYHNGYILALEDILGDFNRLARSGNFTREALFDIVKDSLDSAKCSREAAIRVEADK